MINNFIVDKHADAVHVVKYNMYMYMYMYMYMSMDMYPVENVVAVTTLCSDPPGAPTRQTR